MNLILSGSLSRSEDSQTLTGAPVRPRHLNSRLYAALSKVDSGGVQSKAHSSITKAICSTGVRS